MQPETFLESSFKQSFEWYKAADTKAQVVLALTSVLINITVGSVLLKPDDVHVQQAWLIAFIAALYLVSVVLAVGALWSRGILKKGSKKAHFFGHIANCKNAKELLGRVEELAEQPNRFLDELATEAWIIAKNTKRKHVLVDLAVVSAGLGLVGTLAIGWLNFSLASFLPS